MWATKPVYLPTRAYQASDYYNSQKFVYDYDEFGHVTSVKNYYGDSQTAEDSASFTYHRLPSGKFVFTKQYEGYSRITAAYDNKGMKLWEQDEWSDGDGGWNLYDRTEAIVNAQGIRTGIRQLNGETGMETVEGFLFDSKGRTLQAVDMYMRDVPPQPETSKSPLAFYQAKKTKPALSSMILRAAQEEATPDTIYSIFTWGADNIVNSYTNIGYNDEDQKKDTLQIYNIRTVRNGEYYNQYELFPFMVDDDESDLNNYRYSSTQRYNWNDYYYRYRWFFNGDINYFGQQGTWVTTIDGNTITQAVKIGNILSETSTVQFLENGGYTTTSVYSTDASSEEGYRDANSTGTVQYNSYGALVRDYYRSEDIEENYYYYSESEATYAREYDAQGRPTKTTVTEVYKYKGTHDENIQEYTNSYVETYDEWKLVNVEDIHTGIAETVVAPAVSVYPAADGEWTIENGSPATNAVIYNLQGSVVSSFKLQQGVNTVNVSNLSTGVYVVKVGDWRGKVLVK
ncbi:hypothetical protein AGMMS50262_03970 [Bacteroidia bacterium]|nr:hypothetical protein AGMMS50262_03970 [Bacteroidia bacterium]